MSRSTTNSVPKFSSEILSNIGFDIFEKFIFFEKNMIDTEGSSIINNMERFNEFLESYIKMDKIKCNTDLLLKLKSVGKILNDAIEIEYDILILIHDVTYHKKQPNYTEIILKFINNYNNNGKKAYMAIGIKSHAMGLLYHNDEIYILNSGSGINYQNNEILVKVTLKNDQTIEYLIEQHIITKLNKNFTDIKEYYSILDIYIDIDTNYQSEMYTQQLVGSCAFTSIKYGIHYFLDNDFDNFFIYIKTSIIETIQESNSGMYYETYNMVVKYFNDSNPGYKLEYKSENKPIISDEIFITDNHFHSNKNTFKCFVECYNILSLQPNDYNEDIINQKCIRITEYLGDKWEYDHSQGNLLYNPQDDYIHLQIIIFATMCYLVGLCLKPQRNDLIEIDLQTFQYFNFLPITKNVLHKIHNGIEISKKSQNKFAEDYGKNAKHFYFIQPEECLREDQQKEMKNTIKKMYNKNKKASFNGENEHINNCLYRMITEPNKNYDFFDYPVINTQFSMSNRDIFMLAVNRISSSEINSISYTSHIKSFYTSDTTDIYSLFNNNANVNLPDTFINQYNRAILCNHTYVEFINRYIIEKENINNLMNRIYNGSDDEVRNISYEIYRIVKLDIDKLQPVINQLYDYWSSHYTKIISQNNVDDLVLMNNNIECLVFLTIFDQSGNNEERIKLIFNRLNQLIFDNDNKWHQWLCMIIPHMDQYNMDNNETLDMIFYNINIMKKIGVILNHEPYINIEDKIYKYLKNNIRDENVLMGKSFVFESNDRSSNIYIDYHGTIFYHDDTNENNDMNDINTVIFNKDKYQIQGYKNINVKLWGNIHMIKNTKKSKTLILKKNNIEYLLISIDPKYTIPDYFTWSSKISYLYPENYNSKTYLLLIQNNLPLISDIELCKMMIVHYGILMQYKTVKILINMLIFSLYKNNTDTFFKVFSLNNETPDGGYYTGRYIMIMNEIENCDEQILYYESRKSICEKDLKKHTKNHLDEFICDHGIPYNYSYQWMNVFEYYFGHKLHPYQIDLTLQIIRNQNKFDVNELLMGRGKSSVITPLLVFYSIFEKKNNIMIVVPTHLLRQTMDDFIMKYSYVLGYHNILMMDLKYIEEKSKYNQILYNNRHIVITDNHTLQLLVLKNNIEQNRSINTLVTFIQKCNVIIDEIDTIFDYNTNQLNIPIKLENKERSNKVLNTFHTYYETILNNNNIIRGNDTYYNHSFKESVNDALNYVNTHHYRKDYGFGNKISDSDKNDFIAIPYSANETPMDGSEFSDYILNLVLTTICYHKSGLRKKDMNIILSSKKLSTILEIYIHDIETCNQRDQNYDVYEAIRLYVENYILPKYVKAYSTCYNISSLDILNNNFINYPNFMVGYTGTADFDIPIDKQLYIRRVYHDGCKEEKIGNLFQSPEILKIRKEEDIFTNDTFICYLNQREGNKLKHNVLIDAGYYMIGKSDKEVSDFLHRVTGWKSIIYLSEGVPVIRTYDNNQSSISDLPNKSLKNIQEESYFIYFSQQNTIGIDLKDQPSTLRGLVTVNKNNRSSEIYQALFRLRKLNVQCNEEPEELVAQNLQKVSFILDFQCENLQTTIKKNQSNNQSKKKVFMYKQMLKIYQRILNSLRNDFSKYIIEPDDIYHPLFDNLVLKGKIFSIENYQQISSKKISNNFELQYCESRCIICNIQIKALRNPNHTCKTSKTNKIPTELNEMDTSIREICKSFKKIINETFHTEISIQKEKEKEKEKEKSNINYIQQRDSEYTVNVRDALHFQNVDDLKHFNYMDLKIYMTPYFYKNMSNNQISITFCMHNIDNIRECILMSDIDYAMIQSYIWNIERINKSDIVETDNDSNLCRTMQDKRYIDTFIWRTDENLNETLNKNSHQLLTSLISLQKSLLENEGEEISEIKQSSDIFRDFRMNYELTFRDKKKKKKKDISSDYDKYFKKVKKKSQKGHKSITRKLRKNEKSNQQIRTDRNTSNPSNVYKRDDKRRKLPRYTLKSSTGN